MPEQLAIQAAAVKQHIRQGGTTAVEEVIDLIRQLGIGLKSKIDNVEGKVEDHRLEIEQRLIRYEEVQTKAADRMVTSVERLSRLEAIPERLERIEHDLDAVRAAQIEHTKQTADGFTEVNTRIEAVESGLALKQAEERGRKQVFQAFRSLGSWVVANWLNLIIIVGMLSLAFRPQGLPFVGGGPVTIPQVMPDQSGALRGTTP